MGERLAFWTPRAGRGSSGCGFGGRGRSVAGSVRGDILSGLLVGGLLISGGTVPVVDIVVILRLTVAASGRDKLFSRGLMDFPDIGKSLAILLLVFHTNADKLAHKVREAVDIGSAGEAAGIPQSPESFPTDPGTDFGTGDAEEVRDTLASGRLEIEGNVDVLAPLLPFHRRCGENFEHILARREIVNCGVVDRLVLFVEE